MYWVTRRGFVVEQRGEVVRNRVQASGRPAEDAIYAYNVPAGGFRGLLKLSNLRPATQHEVDRAKHGCAKAVRR